MKNRAWAKRSGKTLTARSSKRSQRKRILHWLKYCGPLTVQKIVMDTQILRADVSRRLAELVQDGLVEEPDGAGIFRAVPDALVPQRRKQLPLFETVNK